VVKVVKGAARLPAFTGFVSMEAKKSRRKNRVKTDECNRKFNFCIDAKSIWHILVRADILSNGG
jgi:hypothetical protein